MRATMASGVLQSVGSFVLSLFGIRTITQDEIPVPDQPYIEFDPAYFLVTPDPGNQRNIVTGAGATASPVLGNVTASTLTFAPGNDGFRQSVRITTTDASPHTLATIAIPGGSIVDIDVMILANLGTASGVANANAPIAPTIYRTNLGAARTPSGSPVASIVKDTSSISEPFLPGSNSATPGCVSYVISGNNLLVQVNGFAATAWATGTAYVTGDGSTTIGSFVTSNGNVYVCTTSGTSSGAAPSGTSTSGTGAVFTYVCAGSTVPVQWTMGAPRVITG